MKVVKDTYVIIDDTKLVNLIAHPITIINPLPPHNMEVTIPPSGIVARCKEDTENLSMLGDIPILKRTFGKVKDLPNECEGTVYIVSKIVASACPERKDLYIPGMMMKSSDGTPIGCYGLSVL